MKDIVKLNVYVCILFLIGFIVSYMGIKFLDKERADSYWRGYRNGVMDEKDEKDKKDRMEEEIKRMVEEYKFLDYGVDDTLDDTEDDTLTNSILLKKDYTLNQYMNVIDIVSNGVTYFYKGYL